MTHFIEGNHQYSDEEHFSNSFVRFVWTSNMDINRRIMFTIKLNGIFPIIKYYCNWQFISVANAISAVVVAAANQSNINRLVSSMHMQHQIITQMSVSLFMTRKSNNRLQMGYHKLDASHQPNRQRIHAPHHFFAIPTDEIGICKPFFALESVDIRN